MILDINLGDFEKEQKALLNILRKPYFVPETKPEIEYSEPRKLDK